MTEVYTDDGARYFGDPRQKVIGPRPDEIAYFNGEIEEDTHSNWKSLLDKFALPNWVNKKTVIGGGAVVAIGGVGGGVAIVRAADDGHHSGFPDTEVKFNFPFGEGETWWLTNGPHTDSDSRGVEYALDLAPNPNVISCTGSSKVYEDKYVRAMASGTVTVAGRENRADPNHSLVAIDHGDGITVQYVHLSNIQVERNERVEAGDELGFASCEAPPSGGTNAVHTHIAFKKNGKPVPVEGLEIAGWLVRGGSGEGEGRLTKKGEEARIAIANRCGPEADSITRCRNIRNDLAWGHFPPGTSVEEDSASDVTPRVSRPTIAPVETVEPTFVPISPAPEEESEDEVSAGGFLVLDGRGDGIRIANSESLRLDGDFTIEARVKVPEGTVDGDDTIFAKGERKAQIEWWYSFWKCGDQTVKDAAAILLGGVGRHCSPGTVNREGWVNAAIIRRGGNLQIVMDGEVILDVEDPGETKVVDEDSFVGRSPVPGPEDFEGMFDGIKVWSVARTADEISEDFENFASISPEPSLVLNMPFDGNALDYSGYGNHGEVMGDAHFQ